MSNKKTRNFASKPDKKLRFRNFLLRCLSMISRLIKTIFFALVLAVIFHNFTARLVLEWGLEWTLGAPVSVDEAKLDLFRGSAVFRRITIKNPADFPSDDFLARIPRLSLEFEFSELFKGHFLFREIEFNLEELRLVRNKEKQLNLLALRVFKPKGEKKENSEWKDEPKSEESKPQFHIERLILTLGRATYVDLNLPVPVQQSFNLGVEGRVFNDIGGVGDIADLIAQEAIKRMGLGRVLDQAIGTFGGFLKGRL